MLTSLPISTLCFNTVPDPISWRADHDELADPRVSVDDHGRIDVRVDATFAVG